MAKKKNTKQRWIVAGLLAMAGYVYQKKFAVSKVTGDVPLYTTDNFLDADKPVKTINIKTGDTLGFIVRSFIAPDYNDGKRIYIFKTKDNLYGFFSEQNLKDKDIKKGWI